MIKQNSSPTNPVPDNAVAIVGMAGRFPGAPDVATFWRNIQSGVESLRRLEAAAITHVPASTRDRAEYVPVRGVLDDADLFDAAFFGITPREAEVMDPQQRLFLECCWHALEDAGRIADRRSLVTGVFAGQSLNTYLLSNLCRDRAFIERISAAYQTGEFPVLFGNDPSFLATRVAHKLDLHGPAITVQTACSTSLVAVVQAVQSLLAFQCDLCLAGGVSISFPQERGHLFLDGSMVSPDGHCRPFDQQAAGTVFGAGVGVVALRRLEDAVAAGDRIHAVIRGAAINNDGAAKSSYSAPSVDGQREAIVTAIVLSGVEPDTIGYVETHGTGTPLGDPIEFEALAKAFRECGATGNGFCTLGSVKGNIGHLEAAAGVAGLIKAALSVRDGVLPPTLHYSTPNPHIDLSQSPFMLSAEKREWTGRGLPRRAGVSSFGVGGTNAHVVLEQAPAIERADESEAAGDDARPAILALSAQTPEAAADAATRLAAHLEVSRSTKIADVAATLVNGRETFKHRIAVAARGRESLAQALRDQAASSRSRGEASADAPQVVFMFPGQGAQRAGMLRGLYESEPLVREVVGQCAAFVSNHLGRDVREFLISEAADPAAAEMLRQTRFTQPCLFITEFALARLWQSWGIQPSAMIGHSVGEYVAACLAGVMSLEDALSAVARRGALVQEQPAGAMLAVRMTEAEIAPLVPEGCSIAAVNAPGLCVVSGPDEAITSLEVRLERDNRPGKRLVTSHAFHSPMMDPIVGALANTISGLTLRAPRIPIASTVTGKWMSESDATNPNYWALHAREAVRFADGLTTILERGPAILLEVGPGRTLVQLARQHTNAPVAVDVVASQPLLGENPDGAQEFSEACALLWTRGVAIDWKQRDRGASRRHVSLPGYPFARTRHWVDAPAPSEVATDSGAQPQPTSELEAVVASTSVSNLDTPPREPRTTRLQREVFEVLEEVSGSTFAGASPEANLLELGFDSLLLAQVSTSLRNRFGVTVSFRQLMEQFTTPAALVVHLDAVLPPDPAPAERLAATSSLVRDAGKPSSTQHADRSPVEILIDQQLEIMRQQLAALGATCAPGFTAAAVALQSAQLAALATSRPQPLSSSGTGDNESAPPARHGPFRPVERSKDESLSDAQHKHLQDLIAAYNARTASSKRYAAEHRAHFCDPRSISGFNPLWKEMVYPIVCERSRGSRLWDPDGNEYIDITMGFGVNYLGHAPDFVARAISQQLEKGFEIGPQTPLAPKVSQLLCELTGMDRATVCNTGSEAVMAAMRVARTVTGRSRIVIFSGDYHGMFDSVLVRGVRKNGEPHTLPIAPGIPRGLIEDITVLDYGADESLAWIRRHAHELAAVIVEPVQSRNPALQPREFLHALRDITRQSDTALVFDEVITGFRCHLGGAQAWFGVKADMATYGKVIGGGMPIGALAGQRKWMDALDGGMWNYGDDSIPEVGVTFFAGTFVRHPLTMAAAWAALNHLKEQGPDLQRRVNARAARLASELTEVFRDRGISGTVDHFSSVFRLELASEYKHAGLLFFHLRLRGIHFWEGRVGFISTAHTDEDIDRIVAAVRESVEAMQSGGFLPSSGVRSDAAIAPSGPLAHEIVVTSEGKLVPVTEAQHEIWMACHISDAASSNFNESGTVTLRGNVNRAALEEAVRQVVDRHEALRSVFLSDGKAQLIKPFVDIRIDSISLPADPAGRTEALRAEAAKPFDLEHGPLVRFRLSEFEGGADFIFTAHHVACDGWSYDTILRELGECYSARVSGSGSPTLGPAAQISVFAAEDPVRAASPAARAAHDYWRKQLENMPPPVELPGDHPRPERPLYNGTRITHVIPAATAQRAKQFARSNRSTFFSFLFTSFGAFIYRLSGATAMLVGVPVAGQHVHGFPTLVAHCVQFVPMRHRVREKSTFTEALRETSVTLLESFDHSHVSFGQLLREIKWERDPSRATPLNFTFNLDPPMKPVRFGDLETSLKINPRSFVITDATFNLVDQPDGLLVECSFSTDVFEKETIARWLGHFQTLLEAAISAPETTLDRLPLLNASERTAMVEQCSPPQEAAAPHELLHQLVERTAVEFPDAIALRTGSATITYRQLDERANRLAHHLAANGAGPEKCVALLFRRSIDFVVAALGVLKSGSVFVPIGATWPAERQALVLKDCGARLLVTAGLSAPIGGSSDVKVVDLRTDSEAIRRQPSTRVNSGVTPDRLAYVIYTSGSTGVPKGVMVEHGSIAAHITSIAKVYETSSADNCLLFHSVAFDPTIEQIFSALHTGASVTIRGEELWTAAEFAGMVSTGGLSVVDIPPQYLLQLLQGWQANGAVPDLGRLRLVIVGGEALPARAVGLWRELGLTHIRLVNSYGPTECSVTATCYDIPAHASEKESEGCIPIGKPHGPVSACVLGPDLEPVPHNVKGELCIGGPTLARGYMGQDELTARRFVQDPFGRGGRIYRTGDLARIRVDGTIEFLGRIDDQVQVRGFRVEPAEIENRLNSHPDVETSAVVAGVDATGGTELIAAIKAKPGVRLATDELRNFLKRHLPHYMIPARFSMVDALPLDANGKLDRRALKNLDTREIHVAAPQIAPRNDVEAGLVEIWCRVLRRRNIGIHDDFFELGGHSLLAMQLVKEIQARFDCTLPLAALLSEPTIEGIASLIGTPAPQAQVAPPRPPAPVNAEERPQAPPVAVAAVEPAPVNKPTPVVKAVEVVEPAIQVIAEPPPRVVAATPAPVPASAPVAATPAPERTKTPRGMRGSGPGVPLFNIPGVFGYGLLPPPVIAHIHRDRPYFDGLQMPGADGRDKPLTTVEAIAENLIGQIRAVQPHGPYALTGYCYGGLIAYEVASRLLGAGEVVHSLVLWHSFPWQTWRLRSFKDRMKDLPGRLAAMPHAQRFDFVKSAVLGPVRDLAIKVGLKTPAPEPLEGDTPIVLANVKANDDYRVRRPYHGRMYVIRATQIPRDMECPPMGGWEGFARGPFKIDDIDCEHLEMIRQPWLTEISRMTAMWLRTADNEHVIRPAGGVPPSGASKPAFPRPLTSASLAAPTIERAGQETVAA